jgi:hypothetical protein
MNRSLATIPLLAAALALAACGGSAAPSGPAATPAGTPSPPAAAASAKPAAVPDTPAAARSAAENLFALYAAGQFPAVYPELDAQTRALVPERKWVRVHQACGSSTSGLSYKIGKPVMAGQSAVMSVSLAGVAAAIGSEEVTFVYQDGRWLWAPSSSDISAAGSYRGTVRQVVARLKAAGECG